MESEAGIISELIEERKLLELREYLDKLSLEDIKKILPSLDPDERTIVFRLLKKEKAAKLFEELSEDVRSNIIERMKNVVEIFEDIPLSELADLLDELPPFVAIELLRTIPKEDRIKVVKLLGYDEEMAARFITSDFVEVREDMTVARALKKVRKEAKEVENISNIYVVDSAGRYVGVVELKDLLTANPKKRIKSIMKHRPYVRANEDREEVIRKLLEEELSEIAVVDSEMKLIGIISADEALEILEEEAGEDIELLGGVSKTEGSEEFGYFYSTLKDRVLSRLPWLIVLLVAGLSSASIIGGFEESLKRVIILAAFIPMLLDTGGNVASQMSALIIRGLATGEISYRNALRLLWEELKSIIIVALLVALVGFTVAWVKSSIATIAFVVSIALFTIVIVSNIVAFVMPFLLKTFKIDPAVASGPVLTTIMDSLGLLIFFTIANAFLISSGF